MHQNLELAREAADALLTLIGLDNCLFTVEDYAGRCAIRVDYVNGDKWRSATFQTSYTALRATLEDEGLRQELAYAWQQRIATARVIGALHAGRGFQYAAIT
jgi:hypothetical protein